MPDQPLPPLLQGIATSADGQLHLHTVAHPIVLDELPLESWLGLPVTGTGELDIDLRVPDPGGKLAPLDTRGTIAIRTTSRIRIGDDATPLKHPRLAALMPGGFPFTHLDIDSLHAQLTVADGAARLTRFDVTSPDLDLRLDLTITLARYILQSTLDGTVHFRLTDAFTTREPILSGRLTLFPLPRDPAGLATLAFTGPLRSPHRVAPTAR